MESQRLLHSCLGKTDVLTALFKPEDRTRYISQDGAWICNESKFNVLLDYTFLKLHSGRGGAVRAHLPCKFNVNSLRDKNWCIALKVIWAEAKQDFTDPKQAWVRSVKAITEEAKKTKASRKRRYENATTKFHQIMVKFWCQDNPYAYANYSNGQGSCQ